MPDVDYWLKKVATSDNTFNFIATLHIFKKSIQGCLHIKVKKLDKNVKVT